VLVTDDEPAQQYLDICQRAGLKVFIADTE
jgi:hypothetical protein